MSQVQRSSHLQRFITPHQSKMTALRFDDIWHLADVERPVPGRPCPLIDCPADPDLVLEADESVEGRANHRDAVSPVAPMASVMSVVLEERRVWSWSPELGHGSLQGVGRIADKLAELRDVDFVRCERGELLAGTLTRKSLAEVSSSKPVEVLQRMR